MCRARAVGLSLLLVALAGVRPRVAHADPPRWTAADPDTMVAESLATAARLGDTPEALARLLVATSLAEEAAYGSVITGLASFGAPGSDIGDQARWLGLSLTAAPPAPPLDPVALRQSAPRADGLLTAFAVLGPFPVTAGGLDAPEGPETEGHDHRTADYSSGSRTVRYVRTLTSSTSARGLPLDLYVAPRDEACAYVETAVDVGDAPRTLVLHLAATGAVRLSWNGREVARDEAVHENARLERLAVTVQAPAGEHAVAVKHCSASQPDDGRVRLRITDERLAPVALRHSSDPERLHAVHERLRATPDATPAAARPTLLQRALTAADTASAEGALVAAITRQLGGADDVRAPRAPGLLSHVADHPTTGPDLLAMAGALAPSGANRSGWLVRALGLASAASDEGTAVFAARQLVVSRLHAGEADLAHQTARAAPLAGRADAHAAWLRAVTHGAFGGGFRLSALRLHLDVAAAHGVRTPVVVLRSIASLSDGQRPALHRDTVVRLAGSAPDMTGPAYVDAHRADGAETLLRAARSVLAAQTDVSSLVRIGDLLLGAGYATEAEPVLALAAELTPNVAGAHASLARARHVLGDAARQAAGIDALERAKELAPSAAKLEAELAFRQPREERTAARDERWLVEPQVFLDRARAAPVTGEVFARGVHWRRVVTYHPDERVSQLVHYAREIHVLPRVEAEHYENLPFANERPELLIARVHRRDGTVMVPEEEDRSQPSVRWPRLEKGDVVEIALRVWTPTPIKQRGGIPFHFVDYVGSIDSEPILYNEVIIDTPVDAPLAFDVLNADRHPPRRVEVTEGGRRVTRLAWDAPPTLPFEPLAPQGSEVMPVVVGSAFPAWKDFLAWYQGAVEGFVEPDEQIRELAARLTKGKRTRDDKIDALFNFVADDIRYVNYVSGEWWLPNRPQHLLARRQGDCDDKAMLLISLLDAVGIEATEVLIQTRLRGETAVLSSPNVAVPLFDHGIIYLPDEAGDGGRFLDATSPQTRIGALPAMDSGAMALYQHRGALKMVQTPAGGAMDHGVTASWKLKLDADGGGVLQASETTTGDAALELRTYLAEEDARAQWVEQNLVAGWLSGVTLDPEVVFDGALPGGDAKLSFTARSTTVARREGKQLVVSVTRPDTLTAILAPLPVRTLPVVLPPHVAPRHRVMDITLEAPPGYLFDEPPPDSPLHTTPFGASEQILERSADKRSLRIRRTVRFEAFRIEVADYALWRAWLGRIDRFMRQPVRLSPAS